jgi:aspartyl-tRNA(Asn)/glutamyl-tRNA(Gln) amidotransferase subunit C
MADTLLSAADVRAIADLARLELSEADIAVYQQQLSDILDYFQKLQELDTSHIDPASSVLPLTNVMRADEAGPALPVADVVANAPDSDGEQFRVRAVLDGGD